MPTLTLEEALTAGASGLYSAEAAVGLLIETGQSGRVVVDWSDDNTMAFIDWDATLDQPLSGGEHRIIRLARQLHDGDIDVSSLDADKVTAITAAIRHANTGNDPHNTVFLHRDDHPATLELLGNLSSHVREDAFIVERPAGLAVDWDGLTNRSRLSTTEIALVHAARAVAVFERHGTGRPYQAVATAIRRLDPR